MIKQLIRLIFYIEKPDTEEPVEKSQEPGQNDNWWLAGVAGKHER